MCFHKNIFFHTKVFNIYVQNTTILHCLFLVVELLLVMFGAKPKPKQSKKTPKHRITVLPREDHALGSYDNMVPVSIVWPWGSRGTQGCRSGVGGWGVVSSTQLAGLATRFPLLSCRVEISKLKSFLGTDSIL